MSHELKEGLQLSQVSGVSGPDGHAWWRLGDEPHHCREIIVAKQVGDMAMVPWAKATTNSEEVHLINLANIESVVLL